jgi:D-alanyl-D-alanine carboxypeptidase
MRRRTLFAAVPAALAAGAVDSPATAASASGLPAALRAVTDAGAPGAFAEVRAGRRVDMGASGVADLDTGRPVQPGFRHRVGSITKTFVATALLQLVGEGCLGLDVPVSRYLPRISPPGVTVRMLLNQTSGIGDYDTVLFATEDDFERHRDTTFAPTELARIGLAAPRTGEPGAGWAYSNTNYVLAGLLLEAVTGDTAEAGLHRRVVRAAGLKDTYMPGRATRVEGPHSKGYIPWPDGTVHEFSRYNMTWAWTAGALVSTTADLNRFFRALLSGRLLGPRELAEMLTTVPTDPTQPQGTGYGLGVLRIPTPYGDAWGHDGVVLGHATQSWHTVDGSRQATAATNVTHHAPPADDSILAAVFALVFGALFGPGGRAVSPVPPIAEPGRHALVRRW